MGESEIIYLLGEITFDESINEQEMSDKGHRFKPKSIGECKVEIYGSEGIIPHMHIYNADKSFETCVCIHSNNYFAHGGKYRSKFSAKQCKEFNDWMRKPNSRFNNTISNWQAIAGAWEIANPDCKFPDNKKLKSPPHYENMVNFKSK